MIQNPILQYLNKKASDITKQDLINYFKDFEIEQLNLRYLGGDGRLKTLNFVISSEQQLDQILSLGERVDGSSLFSHVEADSSDLYVVPRYRTAFINPFTEIPTMDILCYYYTNDGMPLPSAPENIIRKAHKALIEKTGYSFQVMGELEYYISSETTGLYPAVDQKGYHECEPFTKWGFLRKEAMQAITECGGKLKYGHSEVGNFTIGDVEYEQNEIEYLPTDIEEAADQLVIGKWVLRMLGYKYGVNISFAPKIIVGKAGSGLHIHTKLVKNGKNAMIENGQLSEIAKRAIAGYLDLAPSLTAFGNTVPTSYLRLVPHQEAPTKICWGDRNRSVLVRVPLGWLGNAKEMAIDANLGQKIEITEDMLDKQTVEFRCPDGSANIHLLIAGLTVAARHGLEMQNALDFAKEKYVDVNIFKSENKQKYDSLNSLPESCHQSAEELLKQKEIYTKYEVFPEGLITDIASKLANYNDKNLSEELYKKEDELKQLVNKYLHCC